MFQENHQPAVPGVPDPHAVVGFEEDPIRQQEGHMRHRPGLSAALKW